MDIRIKSDEGNFKFRVVGLLKRGDKYLIQKIADNKFFCLPGGHVELGETTAEAIVREMGEELGFEVKVDKLIVVLENIFKTMAGKPFNELGYYFLLSSDVAPTKDWERVEIDKGVPKKLVFKWVTSEELDSLDFRPKILKKYILNEPDKPVVICSKE